MRWGRRDDDRLLADLLLQVVYRLCELRILSLEGGMWPIIHDHVGINAVAFDEPFALRTIDNILGGGRDALIHQPIVE